jgi:hypothetical protein
MNKQMVAAELLKCARSLLAESKKVWIFDLAKNESYVAKSRAECDGNTDKSVYDEVIRADDTITMGQVIGIPERLFGKAKDSLKKV